MTLARVKTWIAGEVLTASDLNTEFDHCDNNLAVSSELAASSGSSLIGFIQAGTGAVATDLQTDSRTSKKLTQWMTAAQIADAQAGTNVLDCSAAATAAIAHCIANNFDLEVPYRVLLSSSVNIDRQVDGAAYDKYFKIFTNSGGGFIIKSNMAMFTSSITFTTAPVSQLVCFEDLNLESDAGGASRLVLNDGRFLRSVFRGCTFDRINCCNSTIYTQSMYFFHNNLRRITGDFWSSTAQSYDFKWIGNICEAITGNVLKLAKPLGCAVMGSLFEGISNTAVVYNGAAGLTISGNYFEANLLDIDGTGATQASGVALMGNYFSHTTGASNSATYSVIWGNGSPVNCVSIGNHHNANMHNFPVAGMDVLVKDSATTNLYNNEPQPIFQTTLALNDGALGNTYGGVVKGYGTGGRGGFLGLGVLNAGTYTEAITIDEQDSVAIGGLLATNAGQGHLSIPTSAGAPSGTPTVKTGTVVLQFDTTNNKLWVYNGAWKSVVLA